ncbi:MAG: hypothetical protein IH621_09530 [Krumholzibacteria bacterium]|nr:hypothetical protein [Candidatus Krumholzibacteria bacterium]
MRRALVICLLAAAALLAACASTPRHEVELGGIALTDVLDGLGVRTNQMLKNLQAGGSAADALQELRDINDGYDDLIFHAWKLSPVGQNELADRAGRQLPNVERLAFAVDGTPLEATLLPELEAMADKVKVLMATPYKAPE